MDYDSSTLIQLKTMCKERGLRVSGTKAEVVIRLMEDDESKSPQPVSIPVQQNVQYGQQQMYGGQPQQIFITNFAFFRNFSRKSTKFSKFHRKFGCKLTKFCRNFKDYTENAAICRNSEKLKKTAKKN